MDEIALRLPREQEWRSVACFVLSGLAARLDLTVETLEDWQLALTELFARRTGNGSVQVVFRVSPDQLETRFGPVGSEIVTELEREDDGVGLRRVLSTLTDSVGVESEEDGKWIVLRRAIVHHDGARSTG